MLFNREYYNNLPIDNYNDLSINNYNESSINNNLSRKNYYRICYCLIQILIMIMLLLVGLVVFNYSPDNNINYKIHKVQIMSIPESNISNYEYFNISISTKYNLLNYGVYYLDNITSDCRPWEPNHLFSEQYDKGYIIPKKDIIDCSTDITPNIVPILPCFNRGILKNVEEYINKNYKFNYILSVPDYYHNYIFDNIHTFIQDKNLIQNEDIPIGFYKIVISNESNLLFSIYIKHNIDNCNKNFMDIGYFEKLPYFINLI